ncbi:hypothetical protein G7084_03625 [Weissella coleopterorum]|uniref:Uncharacterized protein n=1 Tax=Weissella coleopterorum TaxID=2714949 RepID=A0A6G8AZQ6_9LACO|nr:hypothetical protein [Weissella coleopterorum]QIL50486.1 hypothetical protein G7084_03625 [Weissella coleopterorum]
MMWDGQYELKEKLKNNEKELNGYNLLKGVLYQQEIDFHKEDIDWISYDELNSKFRTKGIEAVGLKKQIDSLKKGRL